MTMAERFARLPTAAKLLLILTAVLLPIGIALAWVGKPESSAPMPPSTGAAKTSRGLRPHPLKV